MNLTRDRLNTIGWGMALTICIALTLALTFRVNAVKSQVRLAERQIVSLKQEKMFLETEFETRASQQQLEAFNDVDFCLKVRALGYRNVVTPFAELFHFESSSRGYDSTTDRKSRIEREMKVMRDRHGGDIGHDPCYSPHLGAAPDDFLIAVD